MQGIITSTKDATFFSDFKYKDLFVKWRGWRNPNGKNKHLT